VIADAGYASEENYDYLESKETVSAVKYTSYEIYQYDNCKGCPFRELFKKSEYGQIVQRNEHRLEQKSKVKELLATKEYKTLMKNALLNARRLRPDERQTEIKKIPSPWKRKSRNLMGLNDDWI